MKMIIAIIRPGRLAAVKNSLSENGVTGITVASVKGCGSQRDIVERYRGSEYKIDLHDKVEIKVVVNDEYVDKVVNIVSDAARTNELGDGKIFVLNVESVVRIRTNETGPQALEKK